MNPVHASENSFSSSRSSNLQSVWRRYCAGFRHSADFHARVVLDSDAFRPGMLGEVDDALGVLGVDRVVPIALRVLVSWKKEE